MLPRCRAPSSSPSSKNPTSVLSRFERPRRIRDEDDVGGFDCGIELLNDWLRRHALASDRSGMSRVFVAVKTGRAVGYYGLAMSVIEHHEATRKVSRGMPKHRIPALLITRLAVTRDEQNQGLGRGLLRDAMVRAINVADDVGIRALHVHAKTPEARRSYARFGFDQSPVDELHLQVTIKSLRASLAAALPANDSSS